MIGIVKDKKFLITPASRVKLMFPYGNYSSFDERFFQDKYTKAYENYEKIIYADKVSKSEIILKCQLCDKDFNRRFDFVLHCQDDEGHATLYKKLQRVDPDEILSQ